MASPKYNPQILVDAYLRGLVDTTQPDLPGEREMKISSTERALMGATERTPFRVPKNSTKQEAAIIASTSTNEQIDPSLIKLGTGEGLGYAIIDD